MKFKKSRFLYSAVVIIVGTFASMPVYADPGDLPGGDGGCDPFNPGPGYCPLDTWVIGLAAVALIFGYKQLQKQKKLSL